MSRHPTNSAGLGDVAVVGGGLGGLLTAVHLSQAGHSVTVFDSSNRLGGRATTDKRRGFLFNQGPHALYLDGEAFAALNEVGVVPRGGAPGKKAGILRRGQTHIAPGNVLELLRTSGLNVKEKLEVARLLSKLPQLDDRRFGSQTVDQWLNQLVTTEGARQLIEALVRLTTYTNQPDLLSADVAVKQIQRGLGGGVLYLDGGWQQLVDGLVKLLNADPNVDFRLGQRLTELPDARAVVVATGDPVSSGNLLGSQFVIGNPGSAPGCLGPAARAACLDVGTNAEPVWDLIIGIDEPYYVSDHSIGGRLAPHGHRHIAAVRYLSDGDRGDRERLTSFASKAWGGAANFERATVESRYLHDMVAVSAIPVASGGGMIGRPRVIDSGHSNVFVVGDWVGPIGFLADASAASAKEAAAAVAGHLDSRPRLDNAGVVDLP